MALKTAFLLQTHSNDRTTLWTRVVEGIKGKQKPSTSAHFSLGSPIIPPEELTYGSRTLRSPTSIVHLEYEPTKLEPKPSSEWTRFVCISDTHTRTFDVPDGDVLLHSGDLTSTGTFGEFEKTMKWLYGLPHKVKIVIAGNHDLALHKEWYEVSFMRWNQQKQNYSKIMELMKGRRATSNRLVYLQDEEHTFQVKKGGRTWSVYGSPWSPWFHDWAFNYEREDGKELISKFPKTDILLTHGPPSGIFDATRSGDLAGCEDLRNRLDELRPKLHVFGHIHEAHGAHIHPWLPSADGNYEPPIVQNEHADGGSGDDELEGETGEEGDNGAEDVDRTVFVNAAAFPLQGKGVKKAGSTGPRLYPPFGGPGFQPVVVDLKD